MSKNLARLVYFSHNRIGGPTAAIHAEIERILATSRRNNAAAGITGALLFNRGAFAQLLEGPPETLQVTFERIQRDERHYAATALAFERIERRAFGHWSMGFVGQQSGDLDRFDEFATASGFDPAGLAAEPFANRLEELVRQYEQRAPLLAA